jgi:hypothetical protein
MLSSPTESESESALTPLKLGINAECLP